MSFIRRFTPTLQKIMEYYEQVATSELADDFNRELLHFIREAADRPESFAAHQGGLRRVNLIRFPYHFLFRLVEDSISVLVVRHHRRHPSVGTQRR